MILNHSLIILLTLIDNTYLCFQRFSWIEKHWFFIWQNSRSFVIVASRNGFFQIITKLFLQIKYFTSVFCLAFPFCNFKFNYLFKCSYFCGYTFIFDTKISNFALRLKHLRTRYALCNVNILTYTTIITLLLWNLVFNSQNKINLYQFQENSIILSKNKTLTVRSELSQAL